MDFHEIDTKGKLWIHRVSSVPTYASTDVGRVIYVTGEDRFYFASASAWEVWGSDIIPAGTKMIFYQNTAPTGWTIDGTVADALLSVKGGSNAYNVNGGQLAGTWVQTNHNHTFSDSFSASHSHGVGTHIHQWLDYVSRGNQWTWNSAGTYISVKASKTSNTSNGIMVEVTSADSKNPDVDFYTDQSGGSTASADASDTVSGTTGDGATAAAWRPYGAVCIVATKD